MEFSIIFWARFIHRLPQGRNRISLSWQKNIGFLVKDEPLAGKKAEGHLCKEIEIAKGVGAKSFLGMSYLDLGMLYKAKHKSDLDERNEEIPEEHKMVFRIGVNLGDVVEEKDRIYGDGVNIVARLESICKGDGVCIPGTAFYHVENKLDLEHWIDWLRTAGIPEHLPSQ